MTETAENESKNGSETVADQGKLARQIVRQVEFYFGDYNLMRDTFMRDEMKTNEGWFTMETMLKFKRLSTICSEPTTILEALKTSNVGLLEIDAANQRIRRKPNREIPEDNEDYRKNLKARTVHINGFQSEENIDDINDFLATYGRIEGVQLQRTSDKKFKGSLFATFFKQEDADKFIQAPMVYYKVCELTKMSKADYYHQLNESRQSDKKKRKISEESKWEHDDLKGRVSLKVTGITDDTIIHTDVKQVFESCDVNTIRFFDRLEQMGSEGYLIFQEDRTAEELLEILKTNKGDTKVTIKSAEVEFSVPTAEEKEKIGESYIEARQRTFGRKGKKNQRGQKHNKFQKKKAPWQKKQQGGKRTTFDDNDDEKEKEDEPSAKIVKTDDVAAEN